MYTIIIILVILIFGIAFFVYAIKTAEVYEPPLDHLETIYEDESKQIFYNNLTGLYEAYDHGRLIKKSKKKKKLINLFLSEWQQ
jgi:hypothetical protein